MCGPLQDTYLTAAEVLDLNYDRSETKTAVITLSLAEVQLNPGTDGIVVLTE